MVLKTLDTLGSMHGYGIAQRIQQVSSQMLQLNQGTLYPALLGSSRRDGLRPAGARPRTTAARSTTR